MNNPGTPPLEAQREIRFVDPRSPHEIQFQLESTLLILFEPVREDSKLVLRGSAKITGCPYTFELRFDGAYPEGNFYTLRIRASWEKLPATHHDYYMHSAESWFGYWTKPFHQSALPSDATRNEERSRELEQQCIEAEAHLSSVDAVQQAILSEMREGAYFVTAHKEGGTHLRWNGTHFHRADYGESEDTETFPDDASFLGFLRQFYNGDVSRQTYPEKVPELAAWKLILRLLRR
jgi:hypothetical protein